MRFFQNLKTQHQELGVHLPWGWSYDHAKRVTVRGFLPNLSLLARFPLIFQKCQSLALSAWCALDLGKRSKSIDCSPRIQAIVIQTGYQSNVKFWSIHVQMLITQAWSEVSWKFNNLKLTVWSALALWSGSRSIPPPWTKLLILITPLVRTGVFLFGEINLACFQHNWLIKCFQHTHNC